jgi:hypothetical protein
VRATAADGMVDEDALGVLLGGRLPGWIGADAIDDALCEDCDGGTDAPDGIGRCRRFGPQRVDCAIEAFESDRCLRAASALLGRDGLVRARGYRCPLRRRPARFSRVVAAPIL